MKKILLITTLLITTFNSFSQDQFEQDGVVVPRTLNFEGNKLELNGFGTRSKLWLDVYVQALYVTILSSDAKDILEGNTTMAIRIQILSSLVTSSKFSRTLDKGLSKSVGEDMMPKFKDQAEALEKFITTEITKKGDAFNLIYNPADKSIWVYKNDVLKGKIPGFEFKKAFFGIWLSNNPVDETLKNELLGKY